MFKEYLFTNQRAMSHRPWTVTTCSPLSLVDTILIFALKCNKESDKIMQECLSEFWVSDKIFHLAWVMFSLGQAQGIRWKQIEF